MRSGRWVDAFGSRWIRLQAAGARTKGPGGQAGRPCHRPEPGPRRRERPRTRPDVALTDKGHSSRSMCGHLRKHGIRVVIPVPADRRGHGLRRGGRAGRPPASDRCGNQPREATARHHHPGMPPHARQGGRRVTPTGRCPCGGHRRRGRFGLRPSADFAPVPSTDPRLLRSFRARRVQLPRTLRQRLTPAPRRSRSFTARREPDRGRRSRAGPASRPRSG